ncbi:hypothetical protein BLNAU_5985 [Blattamonas nauphoetae]|uniref:Uncharacterized protein n=1 Tax=Blattamonas nauphoetae TaxID=2049346 RepID=A0ABQ9Y5J1_9EUKA|nr:hypothetical protein BLNAU_5985 [Blattamonas nauphoetae]
MEGTLNYIETLQGLDKQTATASQEATRIQYRLEEERISQAMARIRAYREQLLKFIALGSPGSTTQPSSQDVEDAQDLITKVQFFLTDPISTIPSAVAQETLEQTVSQSLTLRNVGAQDPCPLRFDLPPHSIPSTMPLSLIVPPFNVYAFTIPNFTHSAEYDEFVESPSFMTPPFPFKFRLRVWPRGSAREDSPEDIRVAIVLERGYSKIVEEFEKTLRLRESPKDDTTIYSLRKPYTFDVRVEMLSEYPEKAKQSIQFPFRKEGMAEFKVGREVVLKSFIKKKEVVDGRLMWQERLAAHFLFGWRFPNYMRMADAQASE